jgi:hypothetical protein
MLQEGGIMEKQLAECLAENRIYTLYEGGITMLRKLFNGRRKFAALGALVVLLGSVGIWIWAQMGVGTVPLRVTALDAELSSIKVPINGEWKETGTIKITLSNAPTQFVGRMTPSGPLGETTTATIIWPASISAPLLKELGLESVDVLLVGVIKRLPYSDSAIGSDFTVLKIPRLPLIVVDNYNCVWQCDQGPKFQESAFWQGKPGAELSSNFNLTKAAFQGRDVDALQLKREAFKVASSFFDLPVDVNAFLENSLKLQQGNMHEIVVYIPELNYYQTADLKGKVTLRVGQ